MHTKLKISCIAMGALTLYLGVLPATHAAPAKNVKSPYRLNIKPIELPQVSQQPTIMAPSSPQIYQLEFKYRSHKTPLKTKPEPPPPPSLVVKYLDTNEMQDHLADQPFSDEIARAAQAAALDPSLVHAVIYVESRYRHKAVSPKGAVGLMQVMPDTAARYGLRNAVYVPKGNIKAGTLYLRDLMVMFDNRLDLVLAAYNAGENAVKRHARQIPPYPETRQYVKAVMAKYASNTKYAYDMKYASKTRYPLDIKYVTDKYSASSKAVPESKRQTDSKRLLNNRPDSQFALNNASSQAAVIENHTVGNNKPASNFEQSKLDPSNLAQSGRAQSSVVEANAAQSHVAQYSVSQPNISSHHLAAPNFAGPNFARPELAKPELVKADLKPDLTESNPAEPDLADNQTEEPAEEVLIQQRTQYLPGTGLVIANEDFTFNSESTVY